jgi:hypothetical protein
VPRRFTAIIVLSNLIVGSFLYLSSQAMLFHLSSNHVIFTLTQVDIDKVFIGTVQPPSSSTPLLVTSYPNYPSYFLWLPIALNVFFIIKVIRSSSLSNRLTILTIVANIAMALLMYFSIESLLLSLVPARGQYMAIAGVNFWSYAGSYVSVAGSPLPDLVWEGSNTPSYVLLLSIIVNAGFMIKLQSHKDK